MQKYPPLVGTPTAARTPRRTTASSTPSTAARSTPAGRCASSTPASCTTRAASGPAWRRSRPRDGTRSWSSRRCTSPTTRRSTGSRAYAEAGGHLVLGPRTGYADHEARARTEPARRTARRGRRRPVRRVQQPQRTTSRSRPRRTGRSTCRERRDGDPLGRRPAPSPTPRSSPATTTRTSAAGRRSPPAPTAPAGSPTSAPSPTPALAPALAAGSRPRDAWHRPPASVTATTATSPDGAPPLRPQLVLEHRRRLPPTPPSRRTRRHHNRQQTGPRPMGRTSPGRAAWIAAPVGRRRSG